MTDGWGDTVPVTEDEDLTFLSKPTFWRVGHDLFHFANKVERMDWDQVWLTLTSDSAKSQTVSVPPLQVQQVDFAELFSPGNFTANAQDLQPGLIVDINDRDMRGETYRAQTRHEIGQLDPMIVLGAPPCSVFLLCKTLIRNISIHQNGKRSTKRE